MAYLGCALFVFSWLSVCAEVIFRYFLGRPLIWVVEITEYILVQVTFLGGAWLLKREGHVSVDLVISALKPKTRALVHLITSTLGILICLILTWYSWVATLGTFRQGLIMQKQIGMPKYLVMAVIPLGSFFLLSQFIRRTRTAFSNWKSTSNDGDPERIQA